MTRLLSKPLCFFVTLTAMFTASVGCKRDPNPNAISSAFEEFLAEEGRSQAERDSKSRISNWLQSTSENSIEVYPSEVIEPPEIIFEDVTMQSEIPYEVISWNPDGSIDIAVSRTEYVNETRTREVVGDDGRTRTEAYTVPVPLRLTCQHTVPPGVDVQSYLAETHTVGE
jgi:hypothetical protein